MRKVARLRPSPAMTVAFVAVFVSVAGSATAAKLITGKAIKNNSIASADIRNNSVSASDVRNGSLLRRDFRSGQLPAGPAGPQGAPGRTGRDGFGRLVYAYGDFPVIGPDTQGSDEAVCPAGFSVVGGGAIAESENAGEQAVNSSFPTDGTGSGADGTAAWSIFVDNNSAGDLGIGAYAICANANQVTPFPTSPKTKLKR